MFQSDPVDAMELEEGTYMELEDREDDDEGVGMEELDTRPAMWEWMSENKDSMWESEADADSIILNLALTEDEEEDEMWE